MNIHLGKDSALPPLEPGLKRLYGSRFCPFTERARLALSLKAIEVELVNIKLQKQEKPSWYNVQINPKGSVPCLIIDEGSQISESGEIVEWAEKTSNLGPRLGLVTDDDKKKHEELMNEDVFKKLLKSWHALMFDADVNSAELIANIKDSMRFYEERMTGEFLLSDIKITDVMLFPWFERLHSMFKMAELDFPKEEFPRLNAYIEVMTSLDGVRQEMESTDIHYRFGLTYKQGQPDFDIQ